MITVIGIDPGKNGAMVAMKDDGSIQPLIMPIVANEYDIQTISEWLRSFMITDYKPLYICMEKVHAMPGQGTVSMFNFGFGYGLLHGIIGSLKLPLYLVAPQSWKKLILVDTSKDKDAAVAYVKRMYPNLDMMATPRSKRPHSGIADAVCIANWML